MSKQGPLAVAQEVANSVWRGAVWGGGTMDADEIVGGKPLKVCYHRHRSISAAEACAERLLRHWRGTRRR